MECSFRIISLQPRGNQLTRCRGTDVGTVAPVLVDDLTGKSLCGCGVTRSECQTDESLLMLGLDIPESSKLADGRLMVGLDLRDR